MADVTKILSQIEAGESAAAAQLLPLVYDELRKLAAAKLAQERPGQTLQATGLVHEAYLRLMGDEPDQPWQNRQHFFAAAGAAMRRILIETARRKQSAKYGGGWDRQSLEELELPAPAISADVIALDTALQKLATIDRPAADIVHLRFFAGLPLPEVAKLLEISPRTADRLWAYAKAWLHRELADETLTDKPGGEDSRSIVA